MGDVTDAELDRILAAEELSARPYPQLVAELRRARLEMEKARLDLQAAQQQLAYLWKSTGSCPCGTRRGEAHVIGCPTAAAVIALKETP
jgi:hypothetical protein